MVDLASIQMALALASSAATATGSAVGVVERIKSLVGPGKPATPELEALVNDLAGKLTATNMLNVQLSEAVRDLASNLQREDEFAREKARYELWKTQEGAFVYRPRGDALNGEPEHFICPVCIQQQKISYLADRDHLRVCQTCDKAFRFEKAQPVRTKTYNF